MIKNIIVIGIWCACFTFLNGIAAPCTKLKIINHVSIKGCDTKYCDNKTSLQYFTTSNMSSGGETVNYDSQKVFDIIEQPINYTFGLQINAARIGTAPADSKDRCDQLCGHIMVDRATGKISQGFGSCGDNPYSPTWSIGNITGYKMNKTCIITLQKPIINNPQLCHCDYGGYPCAFRQHLNSIF